MLEKYDDWKGEHFLKIKRDFDEDGRRMQVPANKNSNLARTKAAHERRQKIIPMIKSGMTAREIGNAVGAPDFTIHKDAKALGMSLKKANGKAVK